jgi:hypothetical protein
MKSRFIAVLAAGLISASPAFASNITIDFEGPSSFTSIDQYYNGGLLSGPNLGVSFGLDALELKNDVLGPYFSNAPSPVGVMTPVGAAAVMNVLVGFGFNGEASFYYSYSSIAATSVSVFSGLDGTGTLLGSFSLANNAQSNGCSDSPYCNWSLATLAFNGVARSITFGDAANVAAFDNVTVNIVPEPGSLALLTFGLAGMAISTRSGRLARRKQASL